MKSSHTFLSELIADMKKISAWKRILAVEAALLILCVIPYFFPLHQYAFTGQDLTGDFCSYLEYGEGHGLGCYLDQSLITDESIDPTCLYITTPYVDLPRGSYDVTIVYSTDGSENRYSANEKYSTYSVVAGRQGNRLPQKKQETGYSFFSPTTVKEYQVHANYSGEGYLFLESVTIEETNAWKNILLFDMIIFFLLADGIMLGYQRTPKERKREARLITMALICLVVCSCTPLFSFFLMAGDDLPFHLNRIEAIKTSLLAGQFPNRVSPYWNNGYGYASAVLYGEALLYLPALLRIIGFTVQGAYKVYVAAINLATALAAYGSFEKILKNKKAALLGSIAYVLAPYRLVCIYMRGAVGEYTAMLFIPLIFYGLCQIYRDTGDEKSKGGWFWLLIGYTGLIQCHVISCVVVTLFVGLFCVILLKRTLCVRRLLQLVKAAVGTILINFWFLLPFADYYRHGYASSPWHSITLGRMGSHGAFISQMLSLFQDGYGPSYTVMEGSGVPAERNYALGCFLIILFLYVGLRLYRGREKTALIRLGDGSLAFGLLAAFMSTLWFPWDGIQQMNGLFRMITGNLQFPWRFLGIAGFFLAVLTACFTVLLDRTVSRQISYGALFLLGLAFWLSADYCMYTYTKTVEPLRYVGEESLDSCNMVMGEYIPQGTPMDFAEDWEPIAGEGLTIIQEERQGGTHLVTCQNAMDAETTLDIPFLPYLGYRCYDGNTGEQWNIQLTEPGKVRVLVPPGYEGTLRVRFEEPWYWRVSEAVSLLTFAAWLMWQIGKNAKGRRTAKREEKVHG